MSAPYEAEQLARRVLDALGRGDTDAFAELAAEQIEIHTSRGVRRGHAAALAWAANKYDHLYRRYAVDEVELIADGALLIRGRTQYVWKEDEGLADESPVAIELRFAEGKLVVWRFHEELLA